MRKALPETVMLQTGILSYITLLRIFFLGGGGCFIDDFEWFVCTFSWFFLKNMYEYIRQRPNIRCVLGFTLIQKYANAVRQLAYDSVLGWIFPRASYGKYLRSFGDASLRFRIQDICISLHSTTFIQYMLIMQMYMYFL